MVFQIQKVEYATEAVKQGSATVGLKNSRVVVLATLKRAQSELGAHQRKIFKVDQVSGEQRLRLRDPSQETHTVVTCSYLSTLAWQSRG